jgi:hypothetical protein
MIHSAAFFCPTRIPEYFATLPNFQRAWQSTRQT